MYLLYRIVSSCFPILERIAALFNSKIKTRYAIVKNQQIPKKQNSILIHCASLGESEMAMPIIDLLLQKTNLFIIVSFFSNSGYKSFIETERVKKVFLPVDSLKNAKTFINQIKPKAFIIIKYEFWLNHITLAQKLQIPCYLVNGIFNTSHFVFKWYGKPWLNVLNKFNCLYLQNYPINKSVQDKFIVNTKLIGDLRFNRVVENAKQAKEINRIKSWINNSKKILIIGSSWEEELKMVKTILPKIEKEYSLIIAPHELNIKNIQKIKADFNAELFTEPISNKNTLILNTIGQLKYAYQYANIAFVGGAFKTGLHNILEPLAYGIPVIFGPIHQKFPEANLAISKKVGFEVSTTTDLLTILNSDYKNSNRVNNFINENLVNLNTIILEIENAISFHQNTI